MSWQENCAKRLNHSMQTEADMIDKVNSDIAMDKYISDNSANQKYMYSDVVYADELDSTFKINYGENRSFEISFFECVCADGSIEYKIAKSIEELSGKDYKRIRQIKQDEYDRLREFQSHIG